MTETIAITKKDGRNSSNMTDVFNRAWNIAKGREEIPEHIKGMPGGDALVGPKLEDTLRIREGPPDSHVYEEEMFGEDGDGDDDVYGEMDDAYEEQERAKEMARGIKDPRGKGEPKMPMRKPPTVRDELDSRSVKNREREEAMEEKLVREEFYAKNGRMPPTRELF